MAKKKAKKKKVKRQPAKIFVVLQEGGTSTEWYATAYDDVEEADAAIEGHREATYDAIGPFEFTNPKNGKLEGEILELLQTVAAAAVSHSIGIEF